MATDAPVANTAMEGAGFYNRNSNLQAAGIELALPFLMEAVHAIPTDGQGPLVIADYGSSQGRNSMRPMRPDPWSQTGHKRSARRARARERPKRLQIS